MHDFPQNIRWIFQSNWSRDDRVLDLDFFTSGASSWTNFLVEELRNFLWHDLWYWTFGTLTPFSLPFLIAVECFSKAFLSNFFAHSINETILVFHIDNPSSSLSDWQTTHLSASIIAAQLHCIIHSIILTTIKLFENIKSCVTASYKIKKRIKKTDDDIPAELDIPRQDKQVTVGEIKCQLSIQYIVRILAPL